MSMFRIPADKTRRQQWLKAANVTENDVNEHTRICSRHFFHGDPSNTPALDLGKRFCSPKKMHLDRSKRAQMRARRLASTTVTPSSSRASSITAPTLGSTTDEEPMSVAIEEPLLSDYSVHELPSQEDGNESCTASAARVEYLEAETKYLRSHINAKKPPFFRIEQIAENDSHIKFYTGFTSYALLLSFFEFLGPSVYSLKYWGDSERKTTRRRKNTALTPLNQYFLTLDLIYK